MDLPLASAVCAERGATLVWRPASASTNSDLVARAARAGAEPGGAPLADLTVLATDTQTAGRGRLDRAWSTPPGTALAVSVFVAHTPHRPAGAPALADEVPPPHTAAPGAPHPAAGSRYLGWLPLLAGVAMTRAVRELGVAGAGIKWPNDVLVNGRKLCGILTELTPTGIVVGAGLNVSMTAEQLPVATATSLALEGVPATPALLDAALAAYLRELVELVGRWREAEHPDDLRALVEQHLHTLGLAVRVDLPGQPPLRGTAEGLDDDGRLLVRPAGPSGSSSATSAVVAVAAGDVTHLRYE